MISVLLPPNIDWKGNKEHKQCTLLKIESLIIDMVQYDRMTNDSRILSKGTERKYKGNALVETVQWCNGAMV